MRKEYFDGETNDDVAQPFDHPGDCAFRLWCRACRARHRRCSSKYSRVRRAIYGLRSITRSIRRSFGSATHAYARKRLDL